MTSRIPSSEPALAWILQHPEGGGSGRRQARAALAGGEDDLALAAISRVQACRQQLEALGWRWLNADDPRFPPGLTAISDPPLGLFVRGTLPVGPSVALVGARQATAYGREVAEWFAGELARAGVTIVSGMARGVDAAAHRGAIRAGGVTVAVWGAGPDRVYPPEHAALADEIAKDGALLSEYPPGSPPHAHHFPERNRLIAGLVQAVVVVEADIRSGALITARLALDEGREVLAVPGSVFARLSAGPNGLLRAGAAPALTAQDILEVIGVTPPAALAEAGQDELLSAFRPGAPMSVDELAAVTGKPMTALLETLLRLELEGRLGREPDGRYRRVRHSSSDS